MGDTHPASSNYSDEASNDGHRREKCADLFKGDRDQKYPEKSKSRVNPKHLLIYLFSQNTQDLPLFSVILHPSEQFRTGSRKQRNQGHQLLGNKSICSTMSGSSTCLSIPLSTLKTFMDILWTSLRPSTLQRSLRLPFIALQP